VSVLGGSSPATGCTRRCVVWSGSRPPCPGGPDGLSRRASGCVGTSRSPRGAAWSRSTGDPTPRHTSPRSGRTRSGSRCSVLAVSTSLPHSRRSRCSRAGSTVANRPPRSAVAGPLRQRTTARTSGRVRLVGDASGYVDALTGEGLRVGFAQARAAIACLDDGAAYERAWLAATRGYRVLTTGLVEWATSPARRADRPGRAGSALVVRDGRRGTGSLTCDRTRR